MPQQTQIVERVMALLTQNWTRFALPERLWLLEQVARRLEGTEAGSNPEKKTPLTEWLETLATSCRLEEHDHPHDSSGNQFAIVATLINAPKTLTAWLTECLSVPSQAGESVPQQLRQLLGRVLEAEQSQQPILLTTLSCELRRLLKTYWPARADKDYRSAIELALTTEPVSVAPRLDFPSRRVNHLWLLGIGCSLFVVGLIAWRIVFTK